MNSMKVTWVNSSVIYHLCTEMFSSESYLMQKGKVNISVKYDMFMAFETDKGKDYSCAISSWVLKVGASKGQICDH